VPVQADTEAAAVAEAAVVPVCVKSGDTEAAGAALRPHLDSDTAVLRLQNGAGNAERLARVLGRPVVPVVVYVAAAMEGPGHVRLHGRGDLVLASFPQAARVQAALARAGIACTASDAVLHALWTQADGQLRIQRAVGHHRAAL